MAHGEVFSIQCVAHDDGVTALALMGDLDVATAPLLRAALREYRETSIVLDCTGLEFIDSVSIGLLVAARNRADSDGRTLVVNGTHDHVRRVLEVAGVHDRLTAAPLSEVPARLSGGPSA